MSIGVFFQKAGIAVAENEYLDSTKARRWQSVAQAICDYGSVEEVTDKMADCLYKTLRQIQKDLPLKDLIQSLGDPEQLRGLCEQIDGAHDVKDFLIDAAGQDGDLEDKLSHFIDQSLENCLYDVPYLVAKSSSEISTTQARSIVRSAAHSLKPVIERLARQLAENPTSKLRRTGHRKPPGDKADKTEKMLGESLLAGFRK